VLNDKWNFTFFFAKCKPDFSLIDGIRVLDAKRSRYTLPPKPGKESCSSFGRKKKNGKISNLLVQAVENHPSTVLCQAQQSAQGKRREH